MFSCCQEALKVYDNATQCFTSSCPNAFNAHRMFLSKLPRSAQPRPSDIPENGSLEGLAALLSVLPLFKLFHMCIYNYIMNLKSICLYIYIYMIFKASLPMTCCVALPFMGLDELFRQRSSSKRAAGESRGGEATEEEDTTSINQDQSKAALSVNHEPMSYQ